MEMVPGDSAKNLWRFDQRARIFYWGGRPGPAARGFSHSFLARRRAVFSRRVRFLAGMGLRPIKTRAMTPQMPSALVVVIGKFEGEGFAGFLEMLGGEDRKR